jgi:hypothetical protein
MKNILLIFLFFSVKITIGQTGLTSYSADFPIEDDLKVELVDIEKSEYQFYFRAFLGRQVVELFSGDMNTFSGSITSSIKEFDQVRIKGEKQTKAIKFHVEKIPIDSTLASTIANEIMQSGQLKVPTDSLIDTWTRWYLHCGSLKFEMKKNRNYITQSFHCPWSQPDSVQFKDVILRNYNLLVTQLQLDSVYNEFWNQLPLGKSYSSSGYGMTYKLTEKEEKYWQKGKPRRDYLKSIKDTIDTFIRANINALDTLPVIHEDEDHSCFHDFYLTFGKDGELKEVWTRPIDRQVLKIDGISSYIWDVREAKKCMKEVEEIMKDINLSDFNLEYEVTRTVNITLKDKWMVFDTTIY